MVFLAGSYYVRLREGTDYIDRDGNVWHISHWDSDVGCWAGSCLSDCGTVIKRHFCKSGFCAIDPQFSLTHEKQPWGK